MMAGFGWERHAAIREKENTVLSTWYIVLWPSVFPISSRYT